MTEDATVVDPPALALTALSPADAATGVARDAAITLTFSEPVDCARLRKVATIEELRDPHPPVPAPSAPEGGEPPASLTRQLWPSPAGSDFGSWSCPDLTGVASTDHSCGPDGSRCQVTFTPRADSSNPLVADAKAFEYSSTVKVTLPGGLYADAASLAARGSVESLRATSRGGELPSTVVASFRTEDPPPLALPADGATGVPRDVGGSGIQLVFSEPVDCDQLEANATSVESRDLHPHVPAPTQLAAGTPKSRQLWPALAGGSGGGSWSCPAKPVDSARPCGADGSACVVVFTPSVDVDNLLEGADQKPFEYSSNVTVTLNGGTYQAGTAPATRVTESERATSRGGTLPATRTIHFHVEEPPPLALAMATPGPGSTGIPRFGAAPAGDIGSGAELRLDFSGSKGGVSCASVQSALTVTELLDPMAGGTDPNNLAARVASVVPGALVSCRDGDSTVTWEASPVAGAPFELQYSSEVRVGLAGGAYPTVAETGIDTNVGGQLAKTLGWSFFVVDPPPLHLVSLVPSDLASGIATAPAITATSDQPIQPSSLTTTGPSPSLSVHEAPAELADPSLTRPAAAFAAMADCGAIAGACGLSADRLSFTFVPSAAFHASSSITVALTSAIQSAVATTLGGQLAAPPTATFRVTDPPPVDVTQTEPNGDPGANVSVTSDVVVTFSRAVLCSAFTGAAETGLEVIDCGTSTQPDVSGGDCAGGTVVTPSAISCGAGGATSAATVRFTPPPTFLPPANDWVEVAIGPQVAGDATVVGATTYGTLPQAPRRFVYRTGEEPLQIPSSNPATGGTTPADPTLSLTTNFPVDTTTLVQCDGTNDATCNFFLTASVTNGVPSSSGPGLVKPHATLGLTSGTTLTVQPAAGSMSTDGQLYGLYLCATSSGSTCPGGATMQTIRAQGTGNPIAANYQLLFTVGSGVVSRVSLATGATPASATSGTLDATDSAASPVKDVSVSPASPNVCVTFAGPVTSSQTAADGFNPQNVGVTFTDEFGRTAAVPLADFTFPSASVGCFDFDTTALDNCLGGRRPLLYSTTFTGSIGSAVALVSGNTASAPFAFRFATQGAPSITGAYATSSIYRTTQPLDGDTDVPFYLPNLFVVFGDGSNSAPYPGLLDSSITTGTGGTVQLTSARGTPVDITAGIAAGTSSTLEVQPTAPLSPTTAYTLVLSGGSGGLSDLNGNFLETTTRMTFTTSALTTALVSPAEPVLTPEVAIPFVFSRNVDLASATPANLTATVGGTATGGVVATSGAANGAPRSLSFVATPTWPNNAGTIAGGISVKLNAAGTSAPLLDVRGDPVDAASGSWTGTGNLPSLSSQLPTAITSSNVTLACTNAATGQSANCGALPPSSRTDVSGDQAFEITFAGTGLRERILPTTVTNQSVVLSVDATQPAACALPQGQTAGGQIPLDFTFAPGSSAAPDTVMFRPRQAATTTADRMASSCNYALTTNPCLIANLYGSSPSGCSGTPPLTPISVLLTGEPGNASTPSAASAAVSVTTAGRQSATLSSGSTTAGVTGDSAIVATFTSQAGGAVTTPVAIDPASVTKASFQITSSASDLPLPSSAANFVTYAVSGNVVTARLVSSPYWFTAGNTYTVKIDGVTDLAGRSVTPLTASFTPSGAAPTTTASAPSYVSANGPYPTGAILWQLTEAARPETLTTTTTTATPTSTGNIDVQCTAGGVTSTVYGCTTRDGTDPTKIVSQPAGAKIAAGSACTMTLAGGGGAGTDTSVLRDLEGVPLASSARGTVTVTAP